MGLEAQSFGSLAEARKGFEAYEGVPDLFITDVALTDGNGLDLAEELAERGRLRKGRPGRVSRTCLGRV